MHPCELFRSGAPKYLPHILVYPKVHCAHQLKSAVLGNNTQNALQYILFAKK